MTGPHGRGSSVRLYALRAREAPVAVVFRRGPSKRVLLVFWRTDRDAFFPGQWLKGRIYERRCDLSPSGERLIYFCGQYHKPLATWTAVSRPPYLTALALWPKGDTWGGGGLFADENTILLDHGRREAALAEGFQLPPEIRVLPQEEAWGEGERRSIEELRLCRDGWTLESTGHMVVGEIGAPIKLCTNDPRSGGSPAGPRKIDGPWRCASSAMASAEAPGM